MCTQTVCKYLQPLRTVNAAEIYQIYQENGVKMPDGDSAEPGDLVICSVNGKNFTEPCELGKVLKVKDVKLKAGHRDGPAGQIFVLPYSKQKIRGGNTITNLKSKLCCVANLHILRCCTSS